MDPVEILLAFAIMLASLTVHEAAHAWTADQLGDPTARMLGRVSLNPIVHIDLIGTIILPLIAMFSRLPIIGWAKPVPVNINRLRHPRRDFMIVAAAGPVSNLLQALVAAIIYRVIWAGGIESVLLQDIFFMAVSINLLLAFFNLIPIPPLDGGNVLAGLLPESAAGVFYGLRTYGFILLYVLMLTGVLTAIILPPMLFFRGILLP